MGTWGITAFEDDTALEFYDSFCESEQSIGTLEASFDVVLFQTYNMDALLMEGFVEPLNALVSAELVAACIGKPVATLPDADYHTDMELQRIDFENLNQYFTPLIKLKAQAAINKIKIGNEMHLNVLWMESDSYEEWIAYLDDLLSRLD